MCVCRGGGVTYSEIFLDHFLGFKILNFNFFLWGGGVQKMNLFQKPADLDLHFYFQTKEPCIWKKKTVQNLEEKPCWVIWSKNQICHCLFSQSGVYSPTFSCFCSTSYFCLAYILHALRMETEVNDIVISISFQKGYLQYQNIMSKKDPTSKHIIFIQ